ncbi:MAG: hypothetical protein DMF49_06450, partial [Acidobacteria bacterium]
MTESYGLRTINGQAAHELARELSFPRFPGSEGEARARRLLRERMEGLGYGMEEQPFRYDARRTEILRLTSPLLPFAVLSGLAFLSARAPLLSASAPLLSKWAPLLCWIAATALLILALSLLRWPWLETLFEGDRDSSANLIGRRPPDSFREKPGHRPAVYFVAHVDSKSQPLGIVARGLFFSALTLTSLAGWVLLGLRGFAPGAVGGGALAFMSFLLLIFGVPLSVNVNGNRSPGALDDAAGCSVLVELARILRARDDLPYEPVFAFTGAEEAGMVGASRLAERIARETDPSRCFFVNFDGPGAGRGLLALIHGFVRAENRSPILRSTRGSAVARAAREAASACGVPLHVVRLVPGAGVDGVPL